MARNTLIGIRLERDVFNKLDFFAKGSGKTKIELIRGAIDDFLDSAEDEYRQMAVKEYTAGIINSKKFKEITGVEPGQDLDKIRKENLLELRVRKTK